jgi:hypothetical protein
VPTGAGAPPIVAIGTTGDPATPYAWSVSMAARLKSAVLLTYFGEGHTIYGGNHCVNDAVNEYLITLRPPPPATACGDPDKSEPFIVSDAPVATPPDLRLPASELGQSWGAIAAAATVFVLAALLFGVLRYRRRIPG